jgi:hypothetical protein
VGYRRRAEAAEQQVSQKKSCESPRLATGRQKTGSGQPRGALVRHHTATKWLRIVTVARVWHGATENGP